MKGTSIVCRLAFVALLSWIGCTPLRAQITITSSVSTTNSISVGEQLIYTITVNATNTSVIVSNVLSGPVQVSTISVNPQSLAIQIFTNSTTTVEQMGGADSVVLTVTAQPTGAGTIVSEVIAVDSTFFVPLFTNIFSNVVTNGSSVPPTNSTTADLAVSVVGPGMPVITNDYMPFRLTVTNLGPADASDVVLNAFFTNANPSSELSTINLGLLSVTTNSQLQFTFGTLGSGAVTNLYFILEATNAEVFTLFASVASSTAESDTNNNLVMTNITVTNYLSGQIVASNVTDMTPDFQTGLMDQTVRLTNVGGTNVASVRLVIHGLTNWLYNATGTNNPELVISGTNSGEPFVYYPGVLATNQSVDLHLEYFIPSYTPVPVSNSVFEVPPVSLTPPPGTPFATTQQTNLPSGAVLVEFPSILNRTYTMLYSDNASFSNELVALSLIVAPGDRVQWVDAGPPQTISAPTNAAARFYQVLLNP